MPGNARLVLAVSLSIAFALAVAGAVWTIRDSAIQTARAESLGDLRITADELMRLQLDEETGVRGYVAGRNRTFLDPYRQAERRIGGVIYAEHNALLRVPGDGDDLTLLRQAETIHRDWLDSVALPSIGKRPDRNLSLQYRGKHLMDEFRHDAARIDRDLAARRDRAKAQAQRSFARGIFLTGIALVLAGVLAALAVARLRATSHALHRERAIANVLQSAFMGSSEASAAFGFGSAYVSATEGAAVGGDLFDLHRIDDRCRLVLLADVSGKGVEAATDTALIKYAARTLAQTHTDTAAIARALNDLYRHERANRGSFVVLFVGLLDVVASRMDFVNAGLVSAYVVRDSQPRALAATGPAIGVIPEASYVAQSLVLQPGDQLVLATDGLVEARAPSREFIGEDRLESWVRAESNTRSAQAIVDGLVERLREFTGNKLDDDLAVIALVSKKR